MSTGREERGEHRENLSELDPHLRERLLGLDEPVGWGGWEDVVARSGAVRTARFRRRGGVLLAAAVTCAVALAAVTAFSVSSFVRVGDKTAASEPRELTAFDLGVPPRHPPNTIAWQSRVITSVRLGDGLHTLYVAPTTQGGFCYQWTGDATGGCARLGKGPLAANWSTGRVVGVVSAGVASSVRIVFTDGTTATPHVAWVSDPIDAGFFLYDIPAGKTVARVTSTDNGHTLNQVTWYSV